MDSTGMKQSLNHLGSSVELRKGPNVMKAIFSDVGNIQKTSDKLMFALLSIKFPGMFDENA